MNLEQRTMMYDALGDVKEERYRQHEKWGEQDHPDTSWALVLGEEYGEVRTAILHDIFGGEGNLREELVQVAAVAVAWIEKIDRQVARMDSLMGIDQNEELA